MLEGSASRTLKPASLSGVLMKKAWTTLLPLGTSSMSLSQSRLQFPLL